MNTQTALATVIKKAGAIMLPENKVWKNRMQIKSSSSSRLYIVSKRKTDGVWGCSCPGWTTHRNCKHLRAMGPVLGIIDKIEAPAPSKRIASR